MNPFSSKIHFRHTGLLILRLGIGLSFAFVHGWPKIMGGYDTWESLGRKMTYVGIDFWPIIWGLAAALAEFVGGVLITIGWVTKPASLFLAITMVVASAVHLGQGEGLSGASHALECLVIFIALIFTGPGKYSLEQYLLDQ